MYDRREFLKDLSLTVAAGMATREAVAAPAARPNVLFLGVDDLRANIGCYEDSYAQTPNLDALAKKGTRFASNYCQQAVCNPSRQSLLTGLRPDTIKVWDLKTHFRNTSPGVVTLPEHFKNHGYFAQSFGKIFHGQPHMADPPSWSVPEQFQYMPKRDDYRLAMNHVKRPGEKAFPMEFADASDDDYPDGKVARGAVEALRGFANEKRTQPFFLAVGMRKPHVPFTAPKRYWEMFEGKEVPPVEQPAPPAGAPAIALHNSVEMRGYIGLPATGPFTPEETLQLRRGYYAAMTYTDAQIGRVLDALRHYGLDQNTIIVFWVDHGYHLGEHGLWCKTTNYESDTRVPLMIVDPRRPKGGAVSHALVESLDIFPTLCDMCALPPPKNLEGRSLIPWLNDPSHESPEAAYSQFPRPFFYHTPQPEFMGYAVRTREYRYVEWRRFGTRQVVERELYHLHPGQRYEDVNLANLPEQRPRLQEMSALLNKIAS